MLTLASLSFQGIPQSSTGLCDMYSSPPAGSIMTSDLATSVIEPQSSSVMVTGQIVVTMAAATVTTNNGQSITIPVQGTKSTPSVLKLRIMFK